MSVGQVIAIIVLVLAIVGFMLGWVAWFVALLIVGLAAARLL